MNTLSKYAVRLGAIGVMVLVSLVLQRIYVSNLYPWESRLASSEIKIPRDSKVIRKSEESTVFGSRFAYLFQLPGVVGSCESLGMRDYVGDLAEVAKDARMEFWNDLGGKKPGAILCRRYVETQNGLVVAWAHGDRVILKIIIH